jgi:hypothetical protein
MTTSAPKAEVEAGAEVAANDADAWEEFGAPTKLPPPKKAIFKELRQILRCAGQSAVGGVFLQLYGLGDEI